MTFLVDSTTGNITLYQGDDGKILVEGLNTSKDFIVYFAIYDDKRNRVGSEVSVEAHKSSSVLLSIPSTLTDLLKVPKNEDTAEYYYGIKVCKYDEGIEDTQLIGDSNIGDLNIITVYPKKVEGSIYE